MITEPRLLSDRYRIQGLLGQGGMASVYRGTDEVLGRPVAVKVLAEELARDPSFLRRFRREAQSAASLNHPNVVSVFDTGSDDGTHFIVMELLEGRTLEEICRTERSSPERAVEIAEAVCLALSAAHERGLVHRDVKPANVMIGPNGSVKVMDFGIARAASLDSLTHKATILGTASYLSPEQAQGNPVDARSDIYSLGAVLYEMLTGQPPFDADSPVAVAYKHVNEDPTPPSRQNPDVGNDLDAVTLRALAKDPAARYQTAEAMREALARTRVGPADRLAAVAASDASPTAPIAPQRTAQLQRRTGRPPRRRRWWLPAALVAVLVLLAVGAYLTMLAGRELASPPRSASPKTTSPEPSPTTTTPPPQASEVLSVDAAIVALEGVLTDAFAGGEIEPRAVGEIEREVEAALREYGNGHLGKALEKIDQVRGKLDEKVVAGEIATQETADLIDGALADLALAMEADPPPDRGGDGGGDGDGDEDD